MVRTWMSRRWTIFQRLLALSLSLSSTFVISFYIYRAPTELLFPTELSPSAVHTITDGLLVVNPAGPHPIFQLIRDAEEAWAAKHTSASTTLREAVAEYKRRYHRPPPLGFDKWCVRPRVVNGIHLPARKVGLCRPARRPPPRRIQRNIRGHGTLLGNRPARARKYPVHARKQTWARHHSQNEDIGRDRAVDYPRGRRAPPGGSQQSPRAHRRRRARVAAL